MREDAVVVKFRRGSDTRWTLDEVRAHFEPGERWAYKEPGNSDCLEALIHAIVPDSRPPRVRVVLFEEGFETGRKAVPPGRLKAPWADVEALRDEDARWARLTSDWPGWPALDVAMAVLEDEKSPHWEYKYWRDGAGVVFDVEGLALEVGVPVSELQDPLGFEQDGGTVVGWSVVATLARQALLRDDALLARRMLREVDTERAERAEQVLLNRIEQPWLPECHPAFDSTDRFADRTEEGLRVILGDIIEMRRREDGRLLMLDAAALLNRVHAALDVKSAGKRQRELAAEVEALLERVAVFEREGTGGADRGLRSAASPQESP